MGIASGMMTGDAGIGSTVPYVQLLHLSKEFHNGDGGSDVVPAVVDMSVEIFSGEFVTVIGPSGCGKTTTLRMIAGFEKPTSGTILIDGKDVTACSPEGRRIPMVFQSYALFPHLTVAGNIAYGLKAQRKPEDAIRHDVLFACQMLNLLGLENRFPEELSDGQQQRVALARALVLKPSMILFDEPLSNLDMRLRIRTRNELRRMQKTLGITMVYVTHDQSEALGLPDRVIVMDRGRIVQVGTPEEIYSRPATPFVADFIGNANFLDGNVLEKEPDGSVWVSGDAFHFLVPGSQFDRTPQEGDAAIVSIPATAFRISLDILPTAKTRKFAFHDGRIEAIGVVIDRAFDGSTLEYSVQIGNVDIRAIAPAVPGDIPRIRRGDLVGLSFHPDSVRIFVTRDMP